MAFFYLQHIIKKVEFNLLEHQLTDSYQNCFRCSATSPRPPIGELRAILPIAIGTPWARRTEIIIQQAFLINSNGIYNSFQNEFNAIRMFSILLHKNTKEKHAKDTKKV